MASTSRKAVKPEDHVSDDDEIEDDDEYEQVDTRTSSNERQRSPVDEDEDSDGETSLAVAQAAVDKRTTENDLAAAKLLYEQLKAKAQTKQKVKDGKRRAELDDKQMGLQQMTPGVKRSRPREDNDMAVDESVPNPPQPARPSMPTSSKPKPNLNPKPNPRPKPRPTGNAAYVELPTSTSRSRSVSRSAGPSVGRAGSHASTGSRPSVPRSLTTQSFEEDDDDMFMDSKPTKRIKTKVDPLFSDEDVGANDTRSGRQDVKKEGQAKGDGISDATPKATRTATRSRSKTSQSEC